MTEQFSINDKYR